MMHRCSSSQGNIVGPCSCGLSHTQNNSFSMVFPMPNHISYDETDMYNSFTFSSSSSVDCTLSLGTPSTRLYEDYDSPCHDRRSGNSCMSNLFWHLMQNKSAHGYSQQTMKASRGSNRNGCSSSGNDPLLARRCANCDTTSTPLWRNGPRGPKSLCNACGIRFKKEERRASATNASMAEQQYLGYNNNSNDPWASMQCFSSPANEIKFIEDGDPFLSWRLNVTDRPTSLVHDFTR